MDVLGGWGGPGGTETDDLSFSKILAVSEKQQKRGFNYLIVFV